MVLITSAVEQQQWWLVAVLFLGGLLASAYLFRVLNLAFTSPDKEANLVVEKESKMLSSVGLALITIVIGLNALWLTDILADVT